MHKVNLNIMMVLMTFLISCCVNQKTICEQIKKERFTPAPYCQINFEYNKCQCRCYDYNEHKSLAWRECNIDIDGKAPTYHEIGFCHELVGHFPEAIADIKAKSKRLNNLWINLCK